MVDIRPDMSHADLKDMLDSLKERQEKNLAFKATVWGQEAKEIFAKEIEKNIKKVQEALRVHGVSV